MDDGGEHYFCVVDDDNDDDVDQDDDEGILAMMINIELHLQTGAGNLNLFSQLAIFHVHCTIITIIIIIIRLSIVRRYTDCHKSQCLPFLMIVCM